MIAKIRNQIWPEKLPRWFKILNLFILLPIILWPYVLFSTIFFFDNPSNLTTTFLLFLAINSYPVYLFFIAIINAKLFARQKLYGIILPITIIVAMTTGVIYIGFKMTKKMTEVEQERKAKENNGDLGRGYSKRNNLIYLDDTLVNGADANSFETVSWDWAKDKMHYYYLGKPILEIDYPTFKLLDYHYSIDKNHVYYDDKIIEGADAKTFKYIDGSQDAKDKNSCYRYGEKVDCNVLLEE